MIFIDWPSIVWNWNHHLMKLSIIPTKIYNWMIIEKRASNFHFLSARLSISQKKITSWLTSFLLISFFFLSLSSPYLFNSQKSPWSYCNSTTKYDKGMNQFRTQYYRNWLHFYSLESKEGNAIKLYHYLYYRFVVIELYGCYSRVQ